MESFIFRSVFMALCLLMLQIGPANLCLGDETVPSGGHGALHTGGHGGDNAAHEPDAKFDDKAALETSQAAIGRSVQGFTLRDREGHEVRLEGYRGKPLIVSFIYTACFHTCPIITQNLARVADIARDIFGDGAFQMVTIGFDTRRDSPDKMRIFARQQGVGGEPDWEFLSADADTIARLTDTLGFIFVPSAAGFDHLAQTTVIDANGVVYRQIYGENFSPPLMIEPLKELIFGSAVNHSLLSGLIGKARLWCTIYDPATDSYRFQYSMVAGFVISILFLIGSGIFLFRMWQRVLRNMRS